MRFAEIDAGREWTEPKRYVPIADAVTVLVEDVEAEARRRLRALKVNEWRTREFISGQPMPDDIRHLVTQIEFAAAALTRLSPIPDDYDDDLYWPRMWTR